MDKTLTAKTVIGIVIGAGVGKCIDDVIDAAAPDNLKLPAKILRKIGSWSIGWVVGDLVSEQVIKDYDKTVAQIGEVKQAVIEAKNEIEAQEAQDNIIDISKEVEE